MSDELRFSVMSEKDDIYEVSISRATDNSANLQANCTCGSAQHGEFCVHRFEILEGDISNMVSENLDDIQTLRSWIKEIGRAHV